MLRFSLLIVVNKFHDHFPFLFQLNICWSSNYDILMQTYVAEIAEIVRAQSRDEEEIGLLQGRLSRVRQMEYCRWWNNELCSGDQGIGRSEELAPNLSSSTVRFENPLLFRYSSIRLEDIFYCLFNQWQIEFSRLLEWAGQWKIIFLSYCFVYGREFFANSQFGEMIWSSFPVLDHFSHPLP